MSESNSIRLTKTDVVFPLLNWTEPRKQNLVLFPRPSSSSRIALTSCLWGLCLLSYKYDYLCCLFAFFTQPFFSRHLSDLRRFRMGFSLRRIPIFNISLMKIRCMTKCINPNDFFFSVCSFFSISRRWTFCGFPCIFESISALFTITANIVGKHFWMSCVFFKFSHSRFEKVESFSTFK